MNILGVLLEGILIIGIPILIPMLVILIIGEKEFNIKIKKPVMFILSVIYNCLIGFFGFPIAFFIAFNPYENLNNAIIYYGVLCIMFLILLLPINIFIEKKAKINIILYILVNAIFMVLGYLFMINIRRRERKCF